MAEVDVAIHFEPAETLILQWPSPIALSRTVHTGSAGFPVTSTERSRCSDGTNPMCGPGRPVHGANDALVLGH